MKNFHVNRTKIWGIALLTAFAGAPLLTPSVQAAPDPNPSGGRSDRSNGRDDDKRRNDDKRRDDDRRGNRDNGYESARNHRGTVEILLPNNEFNARINGRIYKVYATSSTRDLRVGDSIDIYGQLDRGVNIRNANVTVTRSNSDRNDRDRNDRDRNDRDRNDRDRYNDGRRDDDRYDNQRDFNTYVGEVTAVKGDREFSVRIDGRSYDVYADNAARRVNLGDIVRISGRRVGSNDIRDARVTVTRAGRNGNDRYGNDTYGSYRTYNGVVTDVKNSREFRARIDGRTYEITSDSTIRDLNRGDEVRVYGRSYGYSEIRNASVRITRDR